MVWGWFKYPTICLPCLLKDPGKIFQVRTSIFQHLPISGIQTKLQNTIFIKIIMANMEKSWVGNSAWKCQQQKFSKWMSNFYFLYFLFVALNMKIKYSLAQPKHHQLKTWWCSVPHGGRFITMCACIAF